MKSSYIFLLVLGFVFADTGRPNDGPCEKNGELLPHKTECTKFYKCDHNELIPFDCPSGLHWNNKEKICDWPENAKCVAGVCDVSSPPPKCPEHDPLGLAVHLPHQYDCTKFYKCDWDELHLFDCPAGLHFNTKLEVCDWPKNAGCECANGGVTTESPKPTTLPPDTMPGTCDQSTPPPKCPEHDSLGPAVHLPHQYDCTKFYKCDWGELYLFDCPAGLHFNPNLEVCDWPMLAGCDCAGESVPVCNESSPQPTCPEHDPTGLAVHLPHQYDCTKFYKCDWGDLYLFDCPAGLHFNPILEVCDWPEYAGCECAAQVN